jgi:hypothetical protein
MSPKMMASQTLPTESRTNCEFLELRFEGVRDVERAAVRLALDIKQNGVAPLSGDDGVSGRGAAFDARDVFNQDRMIIVDGDDCVADFFR